MAKLQNKKDLYAGNNDSFYIIDSISFFFSEYFAHIILWLKEVSLDLSRKSVERDDDVSGVSNLLQLDV